MPTCKFLSLKDSGFHVEPRREGNILNLTLQDGASFATDATRQPVQEPLSYQLLIFGGFAVFGRAEPKMAPGDHLLGELIDYRIFCGLRRKFEGWRNVLVDHR